MFDKGAAYGLKVFSEMKGREVITLPEAEKEKFRVAVRTIIDDWVKKRTAQGYPAAEYVKYIRERIAYWDAKKPK